MKKRILCVPVIAVVLAAVCELSLAQTPLSTAFTYQGQLKEGGLPASGLYDLRFRLFDAAVGGTQVGTTLCADNVSVTNGLFTVPLDFGAQFAGQERFLEIEVRADTGLDCTNPAGFVILAPRQALTAAPNSLFALNALRASRLTLPFSDSASVENDAVFRVRNTATRGERGGVADGLFGQTDSGTGRGVFGLAATPSGVNYGVFGQSNSTEDGTGVFGVVGVAAAAPDGGDSGGLQQGPFGVRGLALPGSGATFGGHFKAVSTSGTGVYGVASAPTGQTYGGLFESLSTGGRAVSAVASAPKGSTYGGRFQSNSTEGQGVYGVATATTGGTYGVFGQSDSPDGYGVYGLAGAGSGLTRGVVGLSGSTSGVGVSGWVTATSGVTYGVTGASESTSGRGVFGAARATSGTTFGGRFESDSTDGRGVYGWATATNGENYGVWGRSNSTSGTGVFGNATAGSGTTYGVFGESNSSSTSAYGVWAQGRLGASGTKSFRIDHPDAPENKYLLHYAAESPEVINFYRGTVVLDGAGGAVVELPHYFAKINKTPSYQLTAMGAPMPLLHVAEEIDEAALSAGAKAEPGEAAPFCSFRIAGGAPGAKVSWRVEALRNDRWVQQRGAPVEVEKQDLERGKYQHPELYGQPPEKGMNYEAEHERPSHERLLPAATPEHERPSPERPSHERPSPATSPEATPEHEGGLLPDMRPQE